MGTEITPERSDVFYKIDDYFFMANNGRIYPLAIESIERVLIEKALEISRGNQITASKVLGIHRNTLHTKVRKLKIDVDKYKI